MSNRVALLAAAVLLGVLADQLLRVEGFPGVNLWLWCIAGLLALAWLSVRRRAAVSREAMVLLAVALLFVTGFVLRDAPSLRALNLLAAAAVVSLAAAEAGSAWIRHGGVLGYTRAGVLTGLGLAAGPLNLLGGAERLTSGSAVGLRARPRALAAARGALLAVPPLVVFGALLMAADPVFARVITDTVRVDLARVAEHTVMIGFFAWLSSGYFCSFLQRSPFAAISLPVREPRIGIIDAAVALNLLSALFLLFVVVQLRYLFGGSAMIEVTPGLSYAEYARRGFFELVAVAALVIPLLLLADWAVWRERIREERIFRGSVLLLVSLLFAIIASATFRMRLYQQAYGLTELRLYTTVFMGWIALVLVWLVYTVFRQRRRRFAFGALVMALSAAALLNVLDPHAFIVRVNAARVEAGREHDVAYTSSLSADAVPALLAHWRTLPSAQRCPLAQRLLTSWLEPAQNDWRTWNLGKWRAERAVAQHAAALRAQCT